MFSRSFRLGLERLDDRNAPSSLFGNSVASTDWMPVEDVDTDAPYQRQGNKAPKIVNFTATVAPGGWVTFSGTVLDEAPAGLSVTINGPQACFDPNAAVVTTDVNGNFTLLVQIASGDSGVVSAVTADAQGLASNVAEFNLTL